MKIYSMTATFGKLEQKKLDLRPGLNIIEAPNEWGKSTWCAFIVAMLYGIDTKERLTQSNLPEKERYKPWSGAPMEGRMDICWKGRNITLERRTRGRLIFGDFRAYETETGLNVPELTAANCGMQLLGVERSVFVRAGFLKLSDMPVTHDEALRRRLNNLVTTGDETGAGEKLAQSLKELKNKCRYNRSGLLPQAEAERDRLEEQLHTLQDLNEQAGRLQIRQKELDAWVAKLENHKTALEYAQAQEKNRHIREAESAKNKIEAQMKTLEEECADIPSAEEAQRACAELQRLHNESLSLQMEQQMLPPAPVMPTTENCFAGLNGQKAFDQAKSDTDRAKALQGKQKSPLVGIGIVAMVLAVAALAGGLFLPVLYAVGGAVMVLGVALLIAGITKKKKCASALQELIKKYGSEPVERWIPMAEEFARKLQIYEEENAKYRQDAAQLQQRREDLVAHLQTLTDGEPVAECLKKWETVSKKWDALGDIRRDFQHAESQIAALQAISKDVPAPAMPDELTQSQSQTDALLANAAFEQKQNQLRLGQFQGQAEAFGQESALRAQLKQVRLRIERLEETYAALEVAQKALSSATSELQRRFAPRIAKRAQELFGKLTNGRYDKVMLTEDLSMHVSTREETTIRHSQWRSDGTVDQLYLALRLAVAEELTPDAPLILDDAMVRFDDVRLAQALNILNETAENKQVILFTCQGREKKLQGE